jgi:uncharacterized protein
MRIEKESGGVLLWIKAVPGASRDGVAGAVGERLKVRISAPPEGGRANRAVCAVLAEALNIKPRDVTIRSGGAHPEKVIHIAGLPPDEVVRRLSR